MRTCQSMWDAKPIHSTSHFHVPQSMSQLLLITTNDGPNQVIPHRQSWIQGMAGDYLQGIMAQIKYHYTRMSGRTTEVRRGKGNETAKPGMMYCKSSDFRVLSGIHGNEHRGYHFFPIPIANIGPLTHCLAQPQINSTMVGLLSLCNTWKQSSQRLMASTFSSHDCNAAFSSFGVDFCGANHRLPRKCRSWITSRVVITLF